MRGSWTDSLFGGWRSLPPDSATVRAFIYRRLPWQLSSTAHVCVPDATSDGTPGLNLLVSDEGGVGRIRFRAMTFAFARFGCCAHPFAKIALSSSSSSSHRHRHPHPPSPSILLLLLFLLPLLFLLLLLASSQSSDINIARLGSSSGYFFFPNRPRSWVLVLSCTLRGPRVLPLLPPSSWLPPLLSHRRLSPDALA